jgi:hypothetical protein
MNGRIQELAREAGFEHPDHVGSCEIYAYFDHEKFAELLLRECADLVDDHDDSYPYVSFGDMIKKHFGVEE